MDYSLPEEHFQQQIETIINEVLGERKIVLLVRDVSVQEGPAESAVQAILCRDNTCEPLSASGEGVADALFTALCNHFAEEFLCLEKIAFEDFNLKAHFKDAVKRQRSDAPVEITLVLKSTTGRRLYFRAQSKSLITAVIEVVQKSVQFLINCEKAVCELYLHIEDLAGHSRYHLVQSLTLQLAELVKVGDFEETIKRVKWQTKNSQ